LADAGVKNSEIAKKMGHNIQTIQRVIKAQRKLLANTLPLLPVKRSGHPRRLMKRR
jgi:hypothetical protein